MKIVVNRLHVIYLPALDIKDGAVTIAVSEGQYDKVKAGMNYRLGEKFNNYLVWV